MRRSDSPRKRRLNSSRVLCAALAGAAAAVALPGLVSANTTWDGGGANANWGTADNWSDNVAPTFAAATALTFSTNTNAWSLSPNNEGTNRTISGITFSAGAPAFTIGGNDITLSGNITNSSTVLQTINLNLAVAATRTVTMTTGGGNVTLGGNISGVGGITAAGTGTLVLSGANSYSGLTTAAPTIVFRGSNSSTGNTSIGNGTVALDSSSNGGLASGTLTMGGNSSSGTRLMALNADRSLSNNLLIAATSDGGNVVAGSYSIAFTGGAVSANASNSSYKLINNIVAAGKKLTLNNINIGHTASNATASLTIWGSGSTVVGGTIVDGNAFANAMNIGGNLTDTTVVTFKTANTYTGATTVLNGMLRLDHANALPGGIGATGGTSALTIGSASGSLNNAVLGLGAGDFLRDVAATPTGAQFKFMVSSGRNVGFAAYGADRIVNIGGAGALLTWSTTGGFIGGGQKLILSMDDSDAMLDFQNPLSLGTSGLTTMTVLTRDGSAAIDARLSGAITGTSGFTFAKDGNGTLELTATNNNYAGATNVVAGVLKVAKQGALYNNTPASWTKTNLLVKSGATLAFNVGGAGEFDATNITTLLTNLTGSNTTAQGFQGGAAIGFDTTNASTSSGFAVADNIVNSTGAGGGAIGVAKRGTGLLVLSGSNGYSGPTTVSGGTLFVNGTTSGTGNVSVASGATLGGTGSVAGALTIAGTLAPGASVETLASGDLSFTTGSTLAVEVDSSVAAGVGADLQKVTGSLSLTGTVNLTIADLAGSPVAFAPGTTFSLVNYTGSWNGNLFSVGGTPVADDASFTAGLNTWKLDYNATSGGSNFSGEYAAGSFVNISVVPEPSSLVGLLGAGALTAIRRRRRN